MAARMKNFLDQTSGLWVQDKVVGGVVTSTGSQHGGEETTIQSTHTVLLRLGTAIIRLPCSFKGQMRMDEITDSLPCGASMLAGEGERQPSANELNGARYRGRHVAEVTRAIVLGRRHLLPQTTRSSTTSSTS
jgi:NAD(P)H dehydrogenase (quinone)